MFVKYTVILLMMNEDIEAEDSVDGSQHPNTTTTTGSEDSNEIRNALIHYFVRNPL